jgi:two-component system, response regulator
MIKMEDLKPVDILIVEDNPHDVELMLRALRKENLVNNLYVVNDGQEALDFIYCRNDYKNRNPCSPLKVVFLDLKLPKINGLEVLRDLKNDDKMKKIPVVIITSSQEDPDIHEAYKLGANAYVVKPVDYGDFQQAINRAGLFWLVVNEVSK